MFCLKGKCVCVRNTDVFAWGVNTGVCVCVCGGLLLPDFLRQRKVELHPSVESNFCHSGFPFPNILPDVFLYGEGKLPTVCL